MSALRRVFPWASALLVGCASVPTGPSVLVLPGSHRSFDEFRADDAWCRQYALQQIGGAASEQAAQAAAVQNAAVGTAIGALAGAAIGGRDAAGVGAGMGLIVGSTTGAETSRRYVGSSQRRYDHAYIQCMYGRGHKVPVDGRYLPAQATPSPPPPPPGPPPPPPPR